MIKKIIYAFLIGLFIFFLIRSWYKKEDLLKHKHQSIAKIIGYKISYRGGLNLIYVFKVDGRQYKSFDGEPDIGGRNGVFFLNKYFPVIYNYNNPGNNKLLLNPIEFKRYDIPFPDSLNWVLEYIR